MTVSNNLCLNIPPLVGIFSVPEKDNPLLDFVTKSTIEALQLAGAETLLFDPENFDSEAFSMLDGIVLAGGEDVNPALYHQNRQEKCGSVNEKRDELEMSALKHAIRHDLPVLGICRGHQIMNVFYGGSLYQDLPSQIRSDMVLHNQKEPFDKPVHTVVIKADTPLFELIQNSQIQVNSLHHQAVFSLSKALIPMAEAENGLNEAFYHPGLRFFWGIQWHPELDCKNNPVSLSILRKFVKTCQTPEESSSSEQF